MLVAPLLRIDHFFSNKALAINIILRYGWLEVWFHVNNPFLQNNKSNNYTNTNIAHTTNCVVILGSSSFSPETNMLYIIKSYKYYILSADSGSKTSLLQYIVKDRQKRTYTKRPYRRKYNTMN